MCLLSEMCTVVTLATMVPTYWGNDVIVERRRYCTSTEQQPFTTLNDVPKAAAVKKTRSSS